MASAIAETDANWKPSRISSIFPEDFTESSGLPQNFTGTIVRARYTVWNYKGKQPKYSLAARLDVRPDEGTVNPQFLDPETGLLKEPLYYSSGSLKIGLPSMDGSTPAGASDAFYMQLAEGHESINPEDEAKYSGIYAILSDDAYARAEKKRQQINIGKNSVWEQFLEDAFASKLPREEMQEMRIDALEGGRGLFDRVPKRSKVDDNKKGEKAAEPAERRDGQDVLVMIEYLGREKGGKAGSTKAGKTGSTAAASSNGSADLDDRVAEAVVAVVLEHGAEGSIKVNQLPLKIAAAFEGAEKGRAVGVWNRAGYKDGRPEWTVNGNTLTLAGMGGEE